MEYKCEYIYFIYLFHPPKPYSVLPCLFRAYPTSRAVTVFLLACSQYVTLSLITCSKKVLRTILDSSYMRADILFTPPLLASRRMAGLVTPKIVSLMVFLLCLLAPTLPYPFPYVFPLPLARTIL